MNMLRCSKWKPLARVSNPGPLAVPRKGQIFGAMSQTAGREGLAHPAYCLQEKRTHVIINNIEGLKNVSSEADKD